MAERRMFAKTIIDSDAFLDMPLSTQALYFHLSMRADDEGFINNPKRIARTIGSNDDELKVLMAKKFIIGFDSGVIVIKHWRIHNYIRGDRIKETVYHDERDKLTIKDNGSYTECQSLGCHLVDSSPSDDSIGKDRLGKDSKESVRTHSSFEKPTIDQIKERISEMSYRIDAERFFNYYESNGWMVGRSKMKCWKSALANWAKEKPKSQPQQSSNRKPPGDWIREAKAQQSQIQDAEVITS